MAHHSVPTSASASIAAFCVSAAFSAAFVSATCTDVCAGIGYKQLSQHTRQTLWEVDNTDITCWQEVYENPSQGQQNPGYRACACILVALVCEWGSQAPVPGRTRSRRVHLGPEQLRTECTPHAPYQRPVTDKLGWPSILHPSQRIQSNSCALSPRPTLPHSRVTRP
jgi:hypothetical protein